MTRDIQIQASDITYCPTRCRNRFGVYRKRKCFDYFVSANDVGLGECGALAWAMSFRDFRTIAEPLPRATCRRYALDKT